MNIGAAVPSMTVKILEAIPLLIPSENALKRFDDTVNRNNQTTMLNFPRYLHISLVNMN